MVIGPRGILPLTSCLVYLTLRCSIPNLWEIIPGSTIDSDVPFSPLPYQRLCRTNATIITTVMSFLWLLTILLSYFILPSYVFTFYFTGNPTQCANMTVEWTGGQPPFTLLLVPVGHLYPETRRIIQSDIQSGNSVSFVLDFPAQSRFVAVLNDASGIGVGGA